MRRSSPRRRSRNESVAAELARASPFVSSSSSASPASSTRNGSEPPFLRHRGHTQEDPPRCPRPARSPRATRGRGATRRIIGPERPARRSWLRLAPARAPRRARRARTRRRTGSRAACASRAPGSGQPLGGAPRRARRAPGRRGAGGAARFAAAPAQRAARSAARTDSPCRTIWRASRRRPSWSGTASTARAWPSVSSPRSTMREHVVRKLEQPDAVRDRRLRAADPLGDLAEREAELVDQHRVRARLLDRRELLARDVLDQRRAAARRGRRRRGRPPERSARPPRGRRASGARRRSARSRRRRAGARRPAG